MDETMENTTAAVEQQDTAENSQNTAETTPEKAEKTFTQKELDEIVRKRLDRAKKDMPSKNELDEFRKWKDGQKTAEQKAAEELAAANSAKEAAEREKNALELKMSCISKGVKPENASDVAALAEKYVDDNTDIDKAIEKVLEKYPSFCGKVKASGITTGAKIGASPDVTAGRSSFIEIARQNQVKRK